MKRTKGQKAITLIALIITIVVLLILAAVAISSITNDGILSYAQNAAKDYNQAVKNEQDMLQGYLNFLENGGSGSGSGAGGEGSGSGNESGYEEVALATAITDTMYTRTANSQTSDIYGNIIKIPAGFKILVDSTTVYTGTTDIAVEKGIVITDGTNEFVYVPVGSIKTASETKNITLARYEFDILTYDETGTPTGFEGTGAIVETYTSATDELTDPLLTVLTQMQGIDNPVFVEGTIEGIDDQGKGYALNIADFISKASTGYYIGRYEARTTNSTARTSTSELTSVTLNKANAVYNWITQPDATDVCQNMYTEKPFTTDLVNSFAWDTAIAFIQSFEDSDYSLKTSVNSSLLTTGTVGAETQDKVCNIYDMASNCAEWSTETCSVAGHHCTGRGGDYDVSPSFASNRLGGSASDSNDDCSFRPLLYL